ncbi:MULTISPECIES: hypothetical protein [unclassified Streptomyces]|uniref:hypothetical protein n=1 Tax=unclassified Streptomyces TaxID=2593676 RepID=UPI000DDA2D81|nr:MULTISPECIES: hypothetical protein [unclassified Streptomyces]QZZ26259.1 hypothetical protein A7X85_08405 [Streptomyces sp. ST1015]
MTTLALGYLILVTAVTYSAMLSDDMRSTGWGRWCFLLAIPTANLAFGSICGSHPLSLRTGIATAFTVGWTTSFAMLADLPLPLPWPQWVVWPFAFAIGLATLAYAWRIWVGKYSDAVSLRT